MIETGVNPHTRAIERREEILAEPTAKRSVDALSYRKLLDL